MASTPLSSVAAASTVVRPCDYPVSQHCANYCTTLLNIRALMKYLESVLFQIFPKSNYEDSITYWEAVHVSLVPFH